jgi:hypothetical protein
MQSDRTIPNNKPDIIIHNNEKGTWRVAISLDRNVIKKEAENILKYKDLTTAKTVYVEFKTLSGISCDVLLPYHSFLPSHSVSLVAIS